VREAWAWLERQALLIPDTRFDHGVSMLSTNAQQLAKELHSMADGEISEAGRKARFEQWEQLGVDVIRTDLEATGGHRFIGGPPTVRKLAREWVRMKEASQTIASGAHPTSSNLPRAAP